MRSCVPILALAVGSLVALPAMADEFRDAWNAGMAALGKANYEKACEHFAKAEAVRGATIKTRYQLGRCNEERGRDVEAHGYFLDAARLAEAENQTRRAEVARTRVSEVEERVPVVVLSIPERVEGMTLEIGDRAIPPPSWEEPIAVEPGKHVLKVSAPDAETKTVDFEAEGPGTRVEVDVPAPSAAGPAAVASDSTQTAGPPAVATDGTVAERSDEPQTRRKSPAGFWTGTGLLIGGGVAGLSGLLIYGADNASAELVGGEGGAPPAAIGLWVVGGAMIGVGIPLMVVFGQEEPVAAEGADEAEEAPEDAVRVVPRIGPTGGSLQVTF